MKRCFRCGAPAAKRVFCWDAGLYWPFNVPVYACGTSPDCPNLFLGGVITRPMTRPGTPVYPLSSSSSGDEADAGLAGGEPDETPDGRDA